MSEDAGINEIVDRRMFYYPGFSIYNEMSGFYDYGPIGLRIRRNVESAWRNLFVERLGSLEIESTTILPEAVLRASGHVATFTDPIAECSKCGTAYRIDKLLEEFYEKQNDSASLNAVKKLTIDEMEEGIGRNNILCQKCGGKLTKVERFNLMFKTNVGHKDDVAYLRPETAQGVFLDFKDIFRAYGMKLPSAICQVGKAYRNEISPRQRLVRMREFTQMETELFFDPEQQQEQLNRMPLDEMLKTKVRFVPAGQENAIELSLADLVKEKLIPNKFFGAMLHLEHRLLAHLGIPDDKYRFRQLEKEELPHYSKGNVDLELSTEYGFIEVAGNAYRGDYDLSAHAKSSNSDISVVNDGRKLTPHVIEASIGLDRLMLALLSNSVANDGRGWSWLKIPESIAPYKYAIFPLQKDEKLVGKALELHNRLHDLGITSYYSETGSIGKRYAKADEMGVPYCITVDFQSLEDGTATVRIRDTTKQERKGIGEIS